MVIQRDLNNTLFNRDTEYYDSRTAKKVGRYIDKFKKEIAERE